MSLIEGIASRARRRAAIQALAASIAWTVIGNGVGRFLVLASMVLAARALGRDGFGAFTLVQSTLGLFGLTAGLGLGVLVTRSIATGRSDIQALERTSRILALALMALLFGTFMSSGLLFFGSGQLSLALFGNQTLQGAFQLGAIWLAVSALRGLQDAILTGCETFRALACLRAGEGVMTVFCVPLGAVFFGLTGAVAGLLCAGLAVSMAAAIVTRQAMAQRGLSLEVRGAWGERHALWSVSVPACLSGLIAVPVLWYCLMSLTSSVGPGETGLYGAAYQWHGPLLFLPVAIGQVLLPRLSWVSSDRNDAAFSTVFFAGLIVSSAISGIPAVAIAMSADWLLAIYGSDFLDAGEALFWLALAAPFHAASKIAQTALTALGRVWIAAVCHFAWAAAVLTLFFLAPAPSAAHLAFAFFAAYAGLAAALVTAVVLLRVRQNGPATPPADSGAQVV